MRSFFSLSTCVMTLILGLSSPALASNATKHVWIQDPWTGENLQTMVEEPDTSLWNGARITDYQNAISVEAPPPLGVLHIESLDLEVLIYNGTEEFNLNRGAGRVKGMARPDEDGHFAISAHRDGYFRVLKDLQIGDEILVQSTSGVQAYKVDETFVIPKHDASVLKGVEGKSLTLITCHPFYFVGHAPDRFIVRASPVDNSLE